MSTSLRVDTAELISGALVIGDTGLGVRGDALPSGGLNGPSFLLNDITLPADAAKEIRGLILTVPSAGTFYVWEDGSFSLIGAPDGIYTFTYRLFVDGVDMGVGTVTITIGTVLSAGGTFDAFSASGTIGSTACVISGATLFDDIVAGGAISGGAPTVISGAITLDDFAANGIIGGGAPTVLSGTPNFDAFTVAGLIDAGGSPPLTLYPSRTRHIPTGRTNRTITP